ncbi:outer membrane protein OmpA-like peptidoglycan-associated protein [Azomonas agilis]|uniref:Outer membrane protein OmpA-like peptidoglycan-associated protein n=1 Tax=Azomonas agilis TaxID=116849 RepID=A0A562I1R0_9GAMM|nr:outer membrane protein OmpA-like peptidoglycan-associated protein [Azomonas agilis]
MKIQTMKMAAPLLLASLVLSGCAVQKPSWPTCAAIGGGTGALLGALDDSKSAAWGGVGLAAIAGGYCWFYADSDGDGVLDRHDQCPDTPKGQLVDATGCPVIVPVVPAPVPPPAPLPAQERIVIHNLLFAVDSAKLSPKDMLILDEAASRLRNEATSTRLVITGHTDNTGAEVYNQKLSERRAQAVADYLIQVGIPRASIVHVGGMGEARPIADNSTHEGRLYNRRVEIDVQR